ncbi:MAG: hypothetical protein HYX81_00045 [Chloroflexi bacterium]|nr:hypothetical protein [Chloroflexota bacterium]
MEKSWKDLSAEAKREQRFEWYRSTQGINFVSPEAKTAYETRTRRMVSVYKVQEPDRVPVSLPIGYIPATVAGLDLRAVMYDPDKSVQAWAKFNEEADLDTFATPAMAPTGKVLDLLDYKLYLWPGHGLSADAPTFQFVEGEYMREDEYDALIRDPSDFWMRTYLPRVFGVMEPFKTLQPVTNITEIVNVNGYFMSFTRPEFRDSLRKLIAVGEELSKWAEVMSKFNRHGLELGFPVARSVFAKAPFDTIGDTLRGTKGIFMDMFRQPDKLLEAIDVVADLTISSTISALNASRGLIASFPLHKGADGWMSEDQFDTFYWTSLRKVIRALIEEGILVSLFAEGSYETRLEKVNEFPRGSIVWLFDKTDMAKAKAALGDKCCISGNVPTSLLHAGTPQEVEEYCRKLIEVCGRGGGFILAGGATGAQTGKVKLDNFRAMLEAAKKYGVYKK